MNQYRITYTPEGEEEHQHECTAEDYEEVYGIAYGITDKGPFKIYQTIYDPETVSGSYEIRVGDLYTEPDYSLNRSHTT